MKNHLYIISVSCAFLILAACGGGDSSSDTSASSEGSNVVEGSSGTTTVRASVNISDNIASVDYQVLSQLSKNERNKDLFATIHWGDNTTDRITGSGSITHEYASPGQINISINSDGNDEVVRLGSFEVSPPAPAPEPEPVATIIPVIAPITSGFGFGLTVKCDTAINAVTGFGILNDVDNALGSSPSFGPPPSSSVAGADNFNGTNTSPGTGATGIVEAKITDSPSGAVRSNVSMDCATGIVTVNQTFSGNVTGASGATYSVVQTENSTANELSVFLTFAKL